MDVPTLPTVLVAVVLILIASVLAVAAFPTLNCSVNVVGAHSMAVTALPWNVVDSATG